MQDRRGDEDGSSIQRRSHLPPLAPRDSRPSSGRERTAASSSGRPPRLSHRSRAGCWTCRGRKVKCDEVHPRCGPCTRLNRECDWDHRWNFNDATTTTQGKYSNVNTSGNAVWDPTVRQQHSPSPIPGQHDDLPDFASLTSDEDRENKARTQRPGTFGVVVTPESFQDLPEYASIVQSQYSSRRASGTSTASSRGGHRSPRPGIGRSNTHPDATTVVLERFEEASPVLASQSPFPSSTSRRGSFPEGLQQLSITTPTYASSVSTAPQTPTSRPDDLLLQHFRQYIVPRLVQLQEASIPGVVSQGSTKDVLEAEAARFPPLHHAMCAISALNLAYNGRSSLEEAMQHYHQALATSATATSANDLLSDGVFFRHFLLFIYDICIPVQTDGDGTVLWAEHLNHLRRIAYQRREATGQDPNAYTLWTICNLDMYACLMGSGTCEFVRTVMNQSLLPPLERQIPVIGTMQTPGAGAFFPNERDIFPAILHLNQGIVLRTAKMAQTAQSFRSEPSSSPGTRARWHATASQLQTEINNFWQQNYPDELGPGSPLTSSSLPERVRCVFENALLLYHAAIIYARTSMFPGQRMIPFAGQAETLADTERRVSSILSVATQQVEAGHVDRRHTVFPLFMAGFATSNGDAKYHATDLIRSFEGKGIGQNTYRTRLLLVAVCEEQTRVAREGRRMEEVDWLLLAKERGLKVVNCGL